MYRYQLLMFTLPFIAIFLCPACNKDASPDQKAVEKITFQKKREFQSLQEEKRKRLDFYCTELKILDENQIACLDQYEQKIVVFNLDLDTLYTFGQKGKGPAEFQRVIDFVKKDDRLIFLDREANALKIFSGPSYKALEGFFRFPFSLERGIINNTDQQQAILQIVGPQFKLNFLLADYSGDSLTLMENPEINRLFTNSPGSSISDDGFFASNKCGDIFYANYLSDKIIKMNNQGEVLKNSRCVYLMPAPEIYIDSKLAYPISSDIHVADLFADCRFIYLLSRIPNEDDELVIDCYNARNLSYQYSFALPYNNEEQTDAVIQIAILADTLYAAYENELVVFKLDMGT